MKKPLGSETIRSDVPCGIVCHLLTFCDENILYIHQFDSKICCSFWHCLQYFVDCEPNDFIHYQTLVWNWRDKFIPKQGFVSTQNAKRDQTLKVGAPLIHCKFPENKLKNSVTFRLRTSVSIRYKRRTMVLCFHALNAV